MKSEWKRISSLVVSHSDLDVSACLLSHLISAWNDKNLARDMALPTGGGPKVRNYQSASFSEDDQGLACSQSHCGDRFSRRNGLKRERFAGVVARSSSAAAAAASNRRNAIESQHTRRSVHSQRLSFFCVSRSCGFIEVELS